MHERFDCPMLCCRPLSRPASLTCGITYSDNVRLLLGSPALLAPPRVYARCPVAKVSLRSACAPLCSIICTRHPGASRICPPPECKSRHACSSEKCRRQARLRSQPRRTQEAVADAEAALRELEACGSFQRLLRTTHAAASFVNGLAGAAALPGLRLQDVPRALETRALAGGATPATFVAALCALCKSSCL